MDDSSARSLRKCNIQDRKLPHHVQNSCVAPPSAAVALLTDEEELNQNYETLAALFCLQNNNSLTCLWIKILSSHFTHSNHIIKVECKIKKNMFTVLCKLKLNVTACLLNLYSSTKSAVTYFSMHVPLTTSSQLLSVEGRFI